MNIMTEQALEDAVSGNNDRQHERSRQDARQEGHRLLRREAGAVRRRPRRPPEPGDRADRPVGLRQVDLPALPQPHERHDRLGAGSPARSRSTARTSTIKSIDVVELRARVGMVFQKPNPFPKSIYENVAYGPRIHGLAKSKARARRDRRIEPEEGGALERGQGPPAASPAPACPAASSSACASRAPSPCRPR